MLLVAAVALTLGLPAAEPAYRLGSATNRVAILPVRCERDLDPSLCMALGESVAIEMGRDPRIEVVNPRDIDVLLGAQTVADLSTCDRDDCFSRQDFTRIDAAYLLALQVSRIGDEARLVVRVVDLKRGTVIDREDAAAPAKDERAIERAARDLAMSVLVRRGLARPPATAEDAGGVGGLFWAGVTSSIVGAAAVTGGGLVGLDAYGKTAELRADASGLTRDEFEDRTVEPRTLATGADMLFAAGGALVVAGGIMMIAGAL
jgi:hypothetical protein